MSALNELKRHLRPGQVYRRKDLEKFSTSVDRHLRQLVDEGRLKKVSGGVYMVPRKTRFGAAPAAPEKLVETFLNDDRYLLVSPNAYNGLGVGTTQLYNEPVVYNLKRHGRFKLGGRFYQFRKKPSVPARLTEEVLLVDLLQNLDRLAEDKAQVLPRALRRARDMDPGRLAKAARDFGSVRAGRLVCQALKAA
ncbi:hypothetical protein [Brevundimonas diminuta]|uniref:hypothetical protein n=1 Tax=Brevundimonas diminuta TaxID=293 RepID=UPI000627BD3E|nr:hypothetical protein [Brevundimonas diminuta]